MLKAIVSILVVIAAVSVAMASSDQKATEFVLCKHQKDVRTIKVVPSEKDNCAITYTKHGTDELVGSSRSASACHSILKSIKGNLEASKWSCRSIQSASTMSAESIQ